MRDFRSMFVNSKPLSLAMLIALSLSSYAYQQEDDWGDSDWGDDWSEEKASPWQWTGFTELARGQFLQDNIVTKSQSLNEARLRLDASYSHQVFEFKAIGDAYYDQVIEDLKLKTRELNIAFSPIDNLDVKLGRQVMTWGTGDYVFLNDLFAKDWQSFFSGRDDEYLKAPSDAIRLTYYFDSFSIDFGYTPEFTPDNYLTGERFSFFSPAAQMQVAPAQNFQVEQTKDETYALRVASSFNGVEVAAYGYKGFWTNPYGQNNLGLAYFPTMYSYGASARTTLFSGIFNVEFAKYNSIEDSKGTRANIANDQVRFLIGYEQELIKNLTMGLQYYVENTQDYQAFIENNPFANQAVDEFRQMATVRLTHRAMQQKLTSSFFMFWSPTDQDGYIKSSISYRYDDNWSMAAGANLFFGKEDYTFWGQHQKNTNAWIRARFSF